MSQYPILWSFRRCPYAMRARLAVCLSGQCVELREIKLRSKPEAFLATSPSATVPCLRLADRVLDESLDIMVWALECDDPLGLLDMPSEGWDLIRENDGPFKAALDHTKYTTRYPDLDPESERKTASRYLHRLNVQLRERSCDGPWLFGAEPKLADFAILPFVRQFAYIDRAWFDAQDWSDLRGWLDRFLDSESFAAVMPKLAPWSEGDMPILTPL